ncbi:unnamed protein product, partial [Ixodes pacificus]
MAGTNFEEGCKPEADSGVCDAHIRRWFFNVKTGHCETFVYGGCGGNENNYKSRKACEIACLRRTGLSVEGPFPASDDNPLRSLCANKLCHTTKTF